MNTKKTIFAFCLTFVLSGLAHAQTVAEKKAALGQHLGSDLSEEMQQFLTQVNAEQEFLQREQNDLYKLAQDLYHQNASPSMYKELLDKINAVKEKKKMLELRWRELATHNHEESYALWHQPSTTLEQLVIDYGSQDFVYLITPEIGAIPVSVSSNLPIPRASWDEMLEMILLQNGVGIRQLNPYLRQLIWLQEDRSGLKLITNQRQELLLYPPNERVAFVLSPEPSDVRRAWFFLEKFINPNTVELQMIGRDILIIAQVSEVQELLKLYDFISKNRGDKEYRVITLNRVDAEEMATILGTIFGVLTEEPVIGAPTGGAEGRQAPRRAPSPPPSDDNGLKIIPLTQVARALFLIGTREEIRKAEQIICEVEEQVGESRGRVIHWYTTKHSDPDELGSILFKIYTLMSTSGADMEGEAAMVEAAATAAARGALPAQETLEVPGVPLRRPYDTGYFLDDRFVINRTPRREQPLPNQDRDNFIVDPKTGAIVMVVEADVLPKIKELIKRLDVPKKMVQIEVLLVEKKLNRENNFGLNLLKIGDCAANCHDTCTSFNSPGCGELPFPLGIFEFLLSRRKTDSFPAFDLVYRFLMSQEDIYINANPSVLAINQTQATIEIAEEISVSTGIFEVESISGVTLKDAFARAQYGIKIDITPTIHIAEDEDPNNDGTDYVTLVTDINFQTINPSIVDRPDVTTRHILNEVAIPDGQTVILGGLRQRNSHDLSEKIPFIGEIPCIGKLFSMNTLTDDTTEMFIFITPKIIYDAVEDLERVRCMEMARRPGDIPEFMCELVHAQDAERDRLFAASMATFLGRKPDRCVVNPGEYDGR